MGSGGGDYMEVYNEIITAGARDYCVRVWQTKSSAPIVLFVGPPIKRVAGRLAHIVLTRFLGWRIEPRPLFFYYRPGLSGRPAEAWRIYYELIGSPHRPLFHHAVLKPLDASKIEQLFSLDISTP